MLNKLLEIKYHNRKYLASGLYVDYENDLHLLNYVIYFHIDHLNFWDDHKFKYLRHNVKYEYY